MTRAALLLGAVILGANLLDDSLDLAGVLLGTTGIGSGLGITIAVMERRSAQEVELWGLRGTAFGFLAGVFLTICVLASRS